MKVWSEWLRIVLVASGSLRSSPARLNLHPPIDPGSERGVGVFYHPNIWLKACNAQAPYGVDGQLLVHFTSALNKLIQTTPFHNIISFIMLLWWLFEAGPSVFDFPFPPQ